MTAGNASQITDGAVALVIATKEKAEALGLKPLARITGQTYAGLDPKRMGLGPVYSTAKLLKQLGRDMKDVQLVEINEAFAPVPMAWLKEIGADPAKVNPSGGAIALGHPLGATGARLMVTLLNELERTNGRFGLQTMCEGGGQANVTIIERL